MVKENENLEDNIKRHIDVMVENVRSDFKVFGEQLSDVSHDLKSVKQDAVLLKNDMDYVKSEIVEIKDRFKEADEMLGKKADKGVVEGHEKRIIKLENSVLTKT